jgi:chemosensory pili system protein ChpA (sensor histidine kinase/response regulator)
MSDASNPVVGHVLVVSDDDRIRDEARFGFSPTLEVALARDAREALHQMETDVPSVVVIDLRAGSAGGYSLCREMRADSRLNDVPLMMLLDRDQDRWLAGEAGADLIRTKPIDTSDLVADALSLLN